MKKHFTSLATLCLLIFPLISYGQWYSNDIVHVQNGGLLHVFGTMEFGGNGPVTVANGGVLTVTSNLITSTSVAVANSGVINLAGNWTNSASVGIEAISGTLNLNGAASVFTDNFSATTALNNLTVNFSAGTGTLTSTDPLQVGGITGGSGTGILTLTNGRVVLSDKNLTITNPAAGAITRTNGLIITDDDAEKVVWQLRTNTGNYVVPFGNPSGNSTFLTMNIGTAGVGNGSVSFNTYGTAANNTPTPATVTAPLTVFGYTVFKTYDRYWSALANGYTTNPTPTSVTVNYDEAEWANPNIFTSETSALHRWPQGGSAWARITPTTSNIAANTAFANTTGFGFFGLTEDITPLPVTLLYLTATSKSTSIMLDWATITEKNNEGFDVERSLDNAIFEKIGFVAGSGTTNRKVVYAFDDKSVKSGQIYYYRLKQTDFDGKTEYSNIVRAKIGSWQASLFPNPSQGKIFVRLDSRPEDGGVSYVLVNAVGQIVEEQTKYLSEGESQFGLDLSHLPSGMYNIRLNDQTGQNGLQKSFVIRR